MALEMFFKLKNNKKKLFNVDGEGQMKSETENTNVKFSISPDIRLIRAS